MDDTTEPVRIGRVVITPEELEALRIRRDFKRLRDAAGWESTLIKKDAAILKGLLKGDPIPTEYDEQTAKQKRIVRSPFTGYGY